MSFFKTGFTRQSVPFILAGLTVTVTPVLAQAQTEINLATQPEKPARPRLRFGPNFNLYRPTSEESRGWFGGSWQGFGFGVGAVDVIDTRTTPVFDFGIYNNNRRGNDRVFFAPVGFLVRRAFTRNQRFCPYVGFGAGVAFVDMRVDALGIEPGVRTAATGSALFGVNLNQGSGTGGFVELRYIGMQSVRDLNLSGLNLAIGLRF